MLYGYNKKPTGRIARARISRVNCSFKDLCEVCRNVRGKDTDFALEFLGNAAEGKQAIYFARHNKKKGHRRELGGKKGGFPVKSCRAVLGVHAVRRRGPRVCARGGRVLCMTTSAGSRGFETTHARARRGYPRDRCEPGQPAEAREAAL